MQVAVCRFTKKGGASVHYVPDDSTPAAAIRELDLQKKYHWSPAELASALGLTGPRAVALRRHLMIDDDDSCRHDFQFGSTRHRQYSDNALTKMREAARDLDMDAIRKRTILPARRAHRAPCWVARHRDRPAVTETCI